MVENIDNTRPYSVKPVIKRVVFVVLLLLMGIYALVSCKINDPDALEEPGDLSRSFVTTNVVDGSSSETGDTASINIVLLLQPGSDVTISVQSDDESEGIPSPNTVVFTPANWNVTQTIMITGVDDIQLDASQDYHISFPSVSSNDSYFNNLSLASLTITNSDNDTQIDALEQSNFTLLKANTNCPTGFVDGSIQMDTEDDDNSSSLTGSYGETEISNNTITLQMCSTTTASGDNITNMKTQSFLILRNGGSCPTGYQDGRIDIDAEDSNNANSRSGNTGDSYVTYDFVTLYACYSNSDSTLDVLKASPFTFFKNGDCPDGSVEGTLKVDTEDNNNADAASGTIGSSYLSNDNTKSVYLKVCTFDGL